MANAGRQDVRAEEEGKQSELESTGASNLPTRIHTMPNYLAQNADISESGGTQQISVRKTIAIVRRHNLQLLFVAMVLQIQIMGVESQSSCTSSSCNPMTLPCGKNLRILTHYSAPFVMFDASEYCQCLEVELKVFLFFSTLQQSKMPPYCIWMLRGKSQLMQEWWTYILFCMFCEQRC